MSKSYTKVWIHAVWSTKNRLPLIDSKIEQPVYDYIFQKLKQLECPAFIINGMPDHVHCLFLLTPHKTLTEVIKQVKGSSSYFINDSEFTSQKFTWQRGYGAFSVSESSVPKVHNYIKNQKEHHKKQDFNLELTKLCELHGLEWRGDENR